MNTLYSPARPVVLIPAFLGLCLSLTHAQPANDMFANRIVITGTNIVVTGDNIGAGYEEGEPYHAGEDGWTSVWWSWTAPSAGTVTISTAGSTFDTLLGVYTGTSVSALTTIASNDDDSDDYVLTSKVVFDVVPGQTYAIAVDGYGGETGNISLSVKLGPLQPPASAPAWAAPDLTGVTVFSTNYAGKVVILDFWATWCGPCKAEMPDLVALQAKYGHDGLVVVGANIGASGDTVQVVQSFLSTFTPSINYQVVMAGSAMIQAYGGVAYIPTTVIIDRQNLLRKSSVGTQSGASLEQQIIPLLYGNTPLGCQRTRTQMSLYWPTNVLGFTLQSTTNVAHPAWSAWPASPSVSNGTNFIQVQLTNAACLFRLRMDY